MHDHIQAAPGAGTVGRRSFLAATGAALGLPAVVGAQGPAARPARATRAKNLILFSVDGMSSGSLSIGDLVRRTRNARGSRWLEWMASPAARTTLVETTPAGALVTDSAAAASAWGIGQRVENGVINITSAGESPTPLFRRAKHAGKAIGLFTTSYLTDASPAALLCTARSRSERDLIARQMVQRELDLGVGGGARWFTDDALAGADVRVARSWPELVGALTDTPDRRTLGLLAPDALPYAIDRPADHPTMRDLAQLAVRTLSRADDGFCLFVENEGVDESAHANDAATLAREMVEAEDTLEYLIAFTESRDDTLLLATTDHACANPAFSADDTMLDRLAAGGRSFDWVRHQLDRLPPEERSAAALAGLMNAASGVRLDSDEVDALQRKLNGERVVPYRRCDRLTSVMGSILANHLGVAFTGQSHAADPVVVTAMGPGADAVLAARHHTDLHALMADALALREA